MNPNNHLILDYLKSLSQDLETKGYDVAEQDAILNSIQHQIYELGGEGNLDTDAQLAILCQMDSVDSYPHAGEEDEEELDSMADQENENPETVSVFQQSSKKLVLALVFVGLVAVVLGGLFWGISTQRKFVQLDEGVRSSEAQVNNVLQRRYDLIPNLVNTVKGYAQHENELFVEVTKLRSQWASQQGEQKRETEQMLEGALSRLLLVSEGYPQLKSSEVFQSLMVSLEGSENRITVERMRFNQSVHSYNAEIRKFPQTAVASWMGLTEKAEYRQISEAAKVAPEVKF